MEVMEEDSIKQTSDIEYEITSMNDFWRRSNRKRIVEERSIRDECK